MAQTNDEIIQIIDSIYRGDGRKAVKRLNETINKIKTEARLAERAKCIAQLKDHQAHCDNCAKDNIEMAIIILEKNEAIE